MRLKDNRDLQKFLQDGQEVNIHTHTQTDAHTKTLHTHTLITHTL